MFDNIYTAQYEKACGYSRHTDPSVIVDDQWSRGLLTKLKSIPIFDTTN